jgi:hypothetical protein
MSGIPLQNRRTFLRISLTSFMGLAALRAAGWDAAVAQTGGRGKRCILLYMNGGPSHIDTFDPKPGARTGGPFRSIKTSLPGLEICEHLPRLAEQAHRLAVIRSMTSREGNHNRARYLLHTGYAPQGSVRHPSIGSIVVSELGARDFALPEYIAIGAPSYGGGAFGSGFDPFFIRDPTKPVQNLTPPPFITQAQFTRRMALLNWFEQRFIDAYGEPGEAHREMYGKTVRMMHSPLNAAFDVSQEPKALREAYGMNEFGQGCLMARRLIEAGVHFVEVSLGGWDTHTDNFEQNRALMGVLDPAFAALLKDLHDRALLDDTLVVWMGEFGRTPRINQNEGRDHFPDAWTAVLAGGGMRAGQVVGATDADGARIVRRPVSVPNLFATIAALLHIDPGRVYYTPNGRPVTVVDNGTPLRELLPG